MKKETFYAVRDTDKDLWYPLGENSVFCTAGKSGVPAIALHKTVKDAAATLAQVNIAEPHLVRVDRTPGSRELVITNRTKIDATKPCVIVDDDDEGFYTGNGIEWAYNLQDARIRVCTDLQEALRAVFQADGPGNRRMNCDGNLKVFNVEWKESEPVDVLTVLE